MKILKKVLFPGLCAAIVLGGCKKNPECEMHYTHLDCQVAFTGFRTDEVDTVQLMKYTAGSNFTSLVEGYAVVTSPQVKDGVIFSDTGNYQRGFFKLEPGIDYKIQFPGQTTEYRITEVVQGAETSTFTASTDNCPMGTSGPWFNTVSCKINGVPASIQSPQANNFFIYISR